MTKPNLKQRKYIVSQLCLELQHQLPNTPNENANNYGVIKRFLKDKQNIYTWLTVDMIRYGRRKLIQQSSETNSSFDFSSRSPPAWTQQLPSALQKDAFKRTKPTKFDYLSAKYSIIEATNWASKNVMS